MWTWKHLEDSWYSIPETASSSNHHILDTSLYDETKSLSLLSGIIIWWQSCNWSLVTVGNICLKGSSSLNLVSGIRCEKNSESWSTISFHTAWKHLALLTFLLCSFNLRYFCQSSTSLQKYVQIRTTSPSSSASSPLQLLARQVTNFSTVSTSPPVLYWLNKQWR